MKKISVVLALVLILSTVFTVTVFALDVANIKEGTYIIQSKLGDNMVLDIDDASKESGANVQLYKRNNTSAQVFEIKKSGDYYTITPKCSGLKLDVKGGSTESGTNVWQYRNNNSDSQKWRFYSAGNGYYYIRCKIGDKALDVADGKSANGTNVQMYTLNQSDAQKWKLIQVYSIIKEDDSSKLTWQYPMKGYSTTQQFGNKGHLGIDIKASKDTKVYAAANGIVKAVGLNGSGTDASKTKSPSGNGYYIVIEHKIGNKKVYSMYAHLQKGSTKVKVGQTVNKGEAIAVFGNTGNSSGRHLHFAITDTFKNGSYYGYTSDRTSFNSDYKKESRTKIIFYNPTYVIKNNKLPATK